VADTSYSAIKQNADLTVQQGRKFARKQIQKYRKRRTAEQVETARAHTASERSVSPKQTGRGTLPDAEQRPRRGADLPRQRAKEKVVTAKTAPRDMYTETLSAQDMDDLCSLLQQAHFKGLSKRLRTVFLTLSISCAPSFAMPKRKISIPFSLTPFRQAAIADCINLLQYIGSQPDMPHYLQYRMAETESLLRFFLLDVPTRILYLEFSADGQLTFCAASNRVPQLLRSALWNTREPTILTSGTLTAAGDFDHAKQLLGLAAYAPLRHFRAESPFNYRKKCLLYIPVRRAAAVPENQYLADQIVRLTAACHGHALVLFTSYRQMRNVYDALGGRLTFPCVPSRARAESQYPTIQAIRQRRTVCGWLLLGGH